MGTLFRRLRGVLTSVVVWSIAFVGLGQLLEPMLPGELGWAIPNFAGVLSTAFTWSLIGAFGGAAFAVLVALDTRDRLEQFSMRRAAAYGTTAALLVPGVGLTVRALTGRAVVIILPYVALYAIAGALTGVAVFTIARRARSVRRSGEEELSLA